MWNYATSCFKSNDEQFNETYWYHFIYDAFIKIKGEIDHDSQEIQFRLHIDQSHFFEEFLKILCYFARCAWVT